MIHVFGVFEEKNYRPVLQSLWWSEIEAIGSARAMLGTREFVELQDHSISNIVAAWCRETHNHSGVPGSHYVLEKTTIFVRKTPVSGSVLSALGAMAD